MGFLCTIKGDTKIVSQDVVKDVNFLRDIGLDNVYNLNPEIIMCPEVFRSPEFYVNGAVKLVSGMTTTLTGCTTGTTVAVYNLDYTPDFNVNFIITGSTDYTGYTGSFCYKVFSNERFVVSSPISGFIKGTESVDTCVTFSAITSTTITQQFLEGGLPKTWAQYLIRPYYTFTTKNCSPGLEFNTWNAVQLNIFQTDSDYYFMTVINPPTPILAPPGTQPIPNYSFIQDNLLINGVAGQRGPQAINDTLNYFMLRAVPAADIMVFVNGVKMSFGYDYKLLSKGFGVPPLVVFQFPIERTDWITANYLVGATNPLLNSDFSNWFIDTFKVDTILVNTNPGYVNAVNSNTITQKQEIYLTQPIDPNNAIFLTINGVEMVENQQFFKSTSQDNRIILTNIAPIILSDVISILAVSPNFIFGGNDYGSIPKPEFTIQWSVPSVLPTNVTGRFVVQVFAKNDPLNTVLYQQLVPFEDGQSHYTTTITSIALNQYYRFRVTYESTYRAYLNNEVLTCSNSEGYFDTKNEYINNTY